MLLIVGVDPGTSSAIALLDVESGYYNLRSEKEFSYSRITKFIVDNGDPVLVSTDVSTSPSLVESIASTFGVEIFTPPRDLTKKEKRRITSNFEVQNDHERDALASALFAKKEYKALLSKIDKILKEKNQTHLSTAVKKIIITKEAPNIETAIKSLTKEGPEEKTKVIPKIISSKKIIEQKKEIERLEKDKSVLKDKIKKLEKDIVGLQKEKESIKRPRRTSKIIRSLRKKLERKETEKQSIKKEFERFKDVQRLKKDNEIVVKVENLKDRPDVKNNVIYVENPHLIRKLENYEPKAIISSTIVHSNIPVIDKDDITLHQQNGILYIKKKDLQSALENSENFFQWLEGYKKRYHE